MAKRFTDTNKYKKPFMRALPGAYKLLWDFLYHDCDHAGIWIVDFEIAQMYVGKDMPINENKAIELFNSEESKILILDGGKKWFIPSFIRFQYGELRDNNKAHIAVINVLSRYGLLERVRVGYNDPVNNNIKGEKRLELFKEWDYTCCYCDNIFSIENLQPDHVVPLNKNGSNSKSNVVCSCKSCNRDKSDKNLFEFISINNLDKNLILKKMSSRGIQAPKEGAMDKDKEQYKEKDKEKEKDKGTETQKIIMPFDSIDFSNTWNTWKTYRKQSGKPYKSELSEQAALKKLSNYPEHIAIKMIQESIANSWQGLFEIKQVPNGKQTTNSIIESFAQRASQLPKL